LESVRLFAASVTGIGPFSPKLRAQPVNNTSAPYSEERFATTDRTYKRARHTTATGYIGGSMVPLRRICVKTYYFVFFCTARQMLCSNSASWGGRLRAVPSTVPCCGSRGPQAAMLVFIECSSCRLSRQCQIAANSADSAKRKSTKLAGLTIALAAGTIDSKHRGGAVRIPQLQI
jgi:hypothetical protein